MLALTPDERNAVIHGIIRDLGTEQALALFERPQTRRRLVDYAVVADELGFGGPLRTTYPVERALPALRRVLTEWREHRPTTGAGFTPSWTDGMELANSTAFGRTRTTACRTTAWRSGPSADRSSTRSGISERHFAVRHWPGYSRGPAASRTRALMARLSCEDAEFANRPHEARRGLRASGLGASRTHPATPISRLNEARPRRRS